MRMSFRATRALIGTAPVLIALSLVAWAIQPSSISARDIADSRPAATCAWSAPGPFASTELVESFAASANSKVVYAATRGPKVFRSDDCGQHWRPTGALPSAIGIWYFAGMQVEPGNPDVAYTYFGEYRGIGIGVYRTMDGGNHWNPLTSGPQNSNVDALAIDPANHAHLIAGTSLGVQSSFDRGNHWTDPAGPQIFNALVFLPKSRSHPHGVIIAAADGWGAFRSLDGGRTWKAAYAGLPANGDFQGNDVTVANGRVYLGTDHGVYVSTDAGAHWIALYGGLTSAVESVRLSGTTVVVATGQGVYTATAAAKRWVLSTGLPAGEVRALARPGSNAKYLLAAPFNVADGTQGVYRSNDGGNTWLPSNSGL